MKRLLLVLIIAALFTFVQPKNQTVLGSSSPVYRKVRVEAARLGKVAHEETTKINLWKIENIERAKQFSDMDDRSLQLDETGHPHIAYGKKHLYYARHDGVQWHYEIVDEAYNVGSYASLALDEKGYPHISYHDDEYDSLKYAYKSVSGWNIEIVDSEGDSGIHTSISLNDKGYPHISYWNGHSLKYAYKDDIGWYMQTIGIGGLYNSLALDNNGHAHISYAHQGKPMYAYQDENGWYIEEVDSCDNCYITSMVLNSSGIPHISYGYFRLMYAYRDTDGWHSEVVDSDNGDQFSIALDAAENPHIIYQNGVGQLKYAYLDTNGWNTQFVETREYAQMFLSLTLDRDGYAHVSYYQCPLCNSKVYNGELYYAFQNASGWHNQTVDKEGDIFGQTSLASDRDGYTHIAYSSGMEMKYALQNKEGWKTLVLAVDNQYGFLHSTSLALDQYEYPHISYISGYHLKYTYQDTAGWHTETVDPDCGWCSGTSIALDAYGNAYICYGVLLDFTYRFGDINYVSKDITGWATELVVDNEGSEYFSLDLDMDGNPHLSYWNTSPNPDSINGIKYSFKDEAGWQIQHVDSGYMYNSLVLDRLDYPHISYDQGKYAYQDANGWHIDTVDECGSNSTLTLDNEGYAHISCFWGDKLRYVYQDDLGWHIETVDNGCYRCDGISLALDNDGKPRISYSDNGDLKYAYSLGNFDVTYLPLVVK